MYRCSPQISRYSDSFLFSIYMINSVSLQEVYLYTSTYVHLVSTCFGHYFLDIVWNAIGRAVKQLNFWELMKNKFSHWICNCVPNCIENMSKPCWNQTYTTHLFFLQKKIGDSRYCNIWSWVDKCDDALTHKLCNSEILNISEND